MASPTVKTAWLASAVARLTGDSGRPCREGKRYRLTVTTADGHRHGVSVQVDTHPDDARPYALNQVADAFKISRKEILAVLEDWTSDQLAAHLQQFKKADLMPPRFRR